MFCRTLEADFGPVYFWRSSDIDFTDKELMYQMINYGRHPKPTMSVLPQHYATDDGSSNLVFDILPFFGGNLTYGKQYAEAQCVSVASSFIKLQANRKKVIIDFMNSIVCRRMRSQKIAN